MGTLSPYPSPILAAQCAAQMNIFKPPQSEEGGWGLHPQAGFGACGPNVPLSSYQILSWKVREMTSSCCSLVSLMKLTA